MIKRVVLVFTLILSFAQAKAEPISKRLTNGTKVILCENRATNLIGVSIIISGGTRFEREGESGTYRLLELILPRGTETRSESAIREQISLLGDSFGISTTAEYWSLDATVPAENLEDLLGLARDILFKPAFSPEDIPLVKKMAIQSIKASEDSPWSHMSELYNEVFYPNFYTEKETRMDNIINTTKASLQRIHRRYFTPENTIVSIAGNIDPKHTMDLVEMIFGSLPHGAQPQRLPVKQQDTPLPLYEVKGGGVTQAGILIGTRLRGFDRREERMLMVLGAVLDNSLGGRLYEQVREKQGLVYSISPRYSLSIEPYTWFVFSTSRRKNIKSVIAETEGVLRGLRRIPVSEAELDLAKAYLKTRLAVSYHTPLDVASYNAIRLLRKLAPESHDERISELEGVSQQELAIFINTYFPTHWTKLVIR